MATKKKKPAPDSVFEDFMTIAEFAEAEGFGKATIYNWVQGGLPVFKRFGLTLIHRPTVRAWLVDQVQPHGQGPKKVEDFRHWKQRRDAEDDCA